MINKRSLILGHFPKTRQKWAIYIKFSLPIILAGLLFSLNGFIDNFMISSVDNGVEALNYANAWTGIIGGILGGISIVCSVLVGQYWGAHQYEKVKQVMRLRVLICFISTSIFALAALFFSKEMISVFYRGDQNADTLQKSIDYLRLISITWVIFSWTSPMSSLLAETGNGKWALISSVGSLLMNMILNIVLINFLKFGVLGAAYASIAARVFGIFGDTGFVYWKEKKVMINPITIFYKIDSQIWKQFLVRIHASIFISSVTILIILRNVIFNEMYPPSSIGNPSWAIGAAAILGLTSAISEIFLAVFSSLGSNVAYFVGTHLGRNEIEEAKANANELKGFHTSVAFFFSIILLIFAMIIPYISYFSESIANGLEDSGKAKATYLLELRGTLLVVALMNPFWTWFSTVSRLIASGGRTNLVSILDLSLEILALIWLATLGFGIKIQNHGVSLASSYLIFFLIDFVKLFVYEFVYWKAEWAKNITESQN